MNEIDFNNRLTNAVFKANNRMVGESVDAKNKIITRLQSGEEVQLSEIENAVSDMATYVGQRSALHFRNMVLRYSEQVRE